MTLTSTSTYTMTCDGTIRAACSATHPDTPHTCGLAITSTTLALAVFEALTMDWIVRCPPGTPALQARHYCPLHAHQAEDPATWDTPHDPCWRSECRTSCAYPAGCTHNARTEPCACTGNNACGSCPVAPGGVLHGDDPATLPPTDPRRPQESDQ